MGLCNSKKKSDIANKLKELNYEKWVSKKLLLLGTGESGKTTIFRQLKNLHGGGFSSAELANMRPQICYNILEGAAILLEAGQRLGISLETDAEKKAGDLVALMNAKFKSSSKLTLTSALVKALIVLRDGKTFEKILQHRSVLQLSDGWETFVRMLDNYPTWGGDDWMPSVQDVLRSRIRSIGVVTAQFTLSGHNGKYLYELLDVGGQQNERTKWFQIFNGIDGLLYVAAMSDYDQKAFEDDRVNRLTDSVTVWENYANRAEFADSAIILFLNKKDLLEKKFCVDKVPVVVEESVLAPRDPPVYSDAISKSENADAIMTWFSDLYYSKLDHSRKTSVKIYFTTALDEANIERVVQALHQHMIEKALTETGFAPDFNHPYV